MCDGRNRLGKRMKLVGKAWVMELGLFTFIKYLLRVYCKSGIVVASR